MSHMPKFLPSLLLRRPIHSLSIHHKPQPSTVLLRLPYPTYSILYHHKSIIHPSIPSPYKKNKMSKKSPLPRASSPASQISVNPRALDQLPIPICKVIKLFNSNNLIQTFLFFPLYLIFFYSIFSFHLHYGGIYLKR